jgi:hypothetical protein
MATKSPPVDYKLASILALSQHEVRNFQRISFYQVLREKNQHAYSLANEATSLKVGELRNNGSKNHQVMP